MNFSEHFTANVVEIEQANTLLGMPGLYGFDANAVNALAVYQYRDNYSPLTLAKTTLFMAFDFDNHTHWATLAGLNNWQSVRDAYDTLFENGLAFVASDGFLWQLAHAAYTVATASK